MEKNTYKVVGVMSGTSLDGVDLALCAFQVSKEGKWTFSIEIAETVPYPESWKTILKEAIHYAEGRLHALNGEYTFYLSKMIAAFIKKHAIQNLDAVCSHGHTVLHQPEKGLTLQIGNLPILAKNLQQTVVCDFRVQDVALGGQGAPLVPIGDRLLFGEYEYCLNLGGFANVSFEKEGKRMAYDICPANIVLNHYAEKVGKPYDAGGMLAASGTVNEALLKSLNDLPFYKEAYPKSLGLEWVQKEIFPLLEASGESPENLLRTFTEHIAQQISRQFYENTCVLVTGGGVYNQFLIERLKEQKPIQLMIPDAMLIAFKEALIFGLLGVLRLRNEVNCLSSVTDARKDHTSGNIFKP